MQREAISNSRKYQIPCIYHISGGEKTVCLVAHGFGSSKNSKTAEMLLEALPKREIGVIAFDFPAHGESPVDGGFLRLANCIGDMAAVEERAAQLAPEAEIVYFASSFGAYITLLFLAGMKREKQRDTMQEKRQEKPLDMERDKDQSAPRAFLRAAAVSMPRLIHGYMTSAQKAALATTGELTFSETKDGVTSYLKLTQGFFDDLKNHDVFDDWREGFAKLHLVHGDEDQTVPLYDVQSFADKFHAPLTVIHGGDHNLSYLRMPEQVLKLAADFYQ